MAFLNNTPTTVTTGNADSYMRAHWDKATLSGSVVTPTLLQATKIKTWRDANSLYFNFEIPDDSNVLPTVPSQPLNCGEQIVLQFGPANTNAANLVLGQHFRYDLTFNLAKPNAADKLLLTRHQPYPAGPLAGDWDFTPLITTAIGTAVRNGNKYTVNLTIPLNEIGTPATDIGLAFAILNDLALPSGSTNYASGTSFPMGMGLTPESDPALNCGAPPIQKTVTGNWKNPSTWGVGYFAVSSTVPLPEVTLDNGPTFAFSRAIRIGNCTVTSFSDIPEVSASNWTTIQTAVGTKWYEYNPDGPCRMGVWINAKVSQSGVVKRRFLVVWGRPGIAPQDWYYAGLTGPVAVSGPQTAVSFLWDAVPKVAFSDHPCMKVYVIPEAADETHAAIAAFKTAPTAANLAAIETAFGAAAGSSKSAQMNFANMKTGSCTTSACQVVASLTEPGPVRRTAGLSLINEARAQPAGGQPRRDGPSNGDDRDSLVRVVLHAFGVAAPRPTKPYVYVEPIGGLGWALPASRLAREKVTLSFDVANPAFTERMVVADKLVEVASVPRRIAVLPLIDAVPGTPVPTLDLSALNRFTDTALAPGEGVKVTIGVTSPSAGMRWWFWLIAILLLLLLLVLYLLRRRSGP